MYLPQATYRLQLHADFSLTQVQNILDYLERLGISTIYASPVLEARVGSTHGYDVINPLKINPEIGTQESLSDLSTELKKRNMGWIQDIVPNHMAFTPDNPWITNVLELGPISPYFTHFDVHWWNNRPDNYGKLMMPILGATLEEVLSESQIQLSADDHGFAFQYYEHRIPLAALTYPGLLRSSVDQTKDSEMVLKLSKLLAALNPDKTGNNLEIEPDRWKEFKDSWQDAFFDEKLRLILNQTIDQVNDNNSKIAELLAEQHFRLAYWRETEREIYYRRFFTVNDLICLNMQEPEVFDDYHQFLVELIRDNILQGLRIDHIDGLFDPTQYLERLRKLVGGETYLVVEKILERDESLPKNWPIQGTTGYDFLVKVNQLFSSTTAEEELTDLYQKWMPSDQSYADLVYQNKLFILRERMQGELTNLSKLLDTLGIIPESNTASIVELEEALAHFLVSFPVYRIYDNQLPLSEESMVLMGEIFDLAQSKAPQLQPAFNTLRNIFNGVPDKSEEVNKNTLYFIQRCQQFSGPLAAKGIEDTTFYQYNRLIARNEVGDSPDKLGITPNEFHRWMQTRSLLTMNATATHDTKRGEDARLRINALSEVADKWEEISLNWKSKYSSYQQQVAGKTYPTENDIYLIYQTLVGTYPFHLSPIEDSYAERLSNYLLKAVREAKINTSWSAPNEDYEKSLDQFAKNLLGDKDFLKSFKGFAHPIAQRAVTYSLGQLVLKTMSPGVPDIYQGTEFWDLSMVDPDNRRPVDYESRKLLLEGFSQFDNQVELVRKLTSRLDDPAIKMYGLYRCLQVRQHWPALFSESYYQPLVTSGRYSSQIVAFLRRHENRLVMVVIPKGIIEHLPEGTQLPLDSFWEDTEVAIPGLPKDFWKNEFTDEMINTSADSLPLSTILQHFPVAILTNQLS